MKVIKKNNCFIIAEVSANHGHDFNRAVKMIKVAKKCGADAVKFQAYTPDDLTINCNNKYFKIKHSEWGGQTLYQLYEKAHTPLEWLPKLKKIADKEKIIFFATAFSKRTVDLLENIKVPFHKIASFELVDVPLIEYVAKTKKPLIISTGASTEKEIEESVSTAKKSGAKEICLLRCVSDYPAKYEEMNLKSIADMKNKFKVPVGLSDHTLGIATSIAGVCLGARIIEKHFTLSRKLKTPDSFFSIEPKELEELVKNIRLAEKSIGTINYGITKSEKKSRVFRRSLFITKDIKKGELFTEENIKSIRPGHGLHPKYFKKIIGKKTTYDIKKGTPLGWGLIK
jgi:pseudaminic acid synthase